MMSELFRKFKDSQFVAHISFLWHWKNFFFLLKYPFYRVYNRWNGKFCGYAYTEYDFIESGWQIAFGKQLSEDIKRAGKESRKRIGKHLSWRKMLYWEQIKEKWGELCLYASCTNEIRKVLDRYELMSIGYCQFCGKPARYRTRGWVSYLCESCFEKDFAYPEDVAEAKIACRLTVKDIPHGVTYTRNKQGKLIEHKINYKNKYGLDYKEMWGLTK